KAHGLRAVGPVIVKKIFVRAERGMRKIPRMLITWTISKSAAHSCSFFVKQQTRQRGLPLILRMKDLFVLKKHVPFRYLCDDQAMQLIAFSDRSHSHALRRRHRKF